MKIDLHCRRQNCSPLNVLFRDAQTTLILLGVPPLGVYYHNTVGESGDFQPLHPKISRNSQTVSNGATVTINHQ